MGSTREVLILASASVARAAMLRAAGIEFSAIPSALDEGAIKRRFRAAGGDPLACAAALAEAKAQNISRQNPGALVIGADQILVAGGEWFDKPMNLSEARVQLRQLSGRSHVLATAACVVQGDIRLCQATAVPELTMRRLGEGFLARYIAAEGKTLLGSVGAYRIEGRGVQLFTRIVGDHFAIRGLPLLPLLAFLRRHGLARE